MYAAIRSATLYGIEAALVQVEVDVAPGLPGMVIEYVYEPIREGKARFISQGEPQLAARSHSTPAK